MRKKIVLLLVLLTLICFNYLASLANEGNTSLKDQSSIKDKSKLFEEEDIKKVAWTENLRFRDFYLSSEALELKEKLKNYRDTLARTYQEQPSVFSTAISFGLVLIDLGELDKAQIVWDRAQKDFYANPTPPFYGAWLDACKGNYQKAKDVWLPIVKQKIDAGIGGYGAGVWMPYHVFSVVGLNIVKDYLPDADKKEVEASVNEVAKHFPNNPVFALVLATNDLRVGKVKSAAKLLEDVLSKKPQEPQITTLLGLTKLIEQNYDEALKLFDKSNEIYPFSPTNHLMKARALFALRKKKEALAEIDEAVKLDPGWTLLKGDKKKFLSPKSYIASLTS